MRPAADDDVLLDDLLVDDLLLAGRGVGHDGLQRPALA